MAATSPRKPVRILIINPNSSRGMTHGIEEAVRGVNLGESTEIHTYTAPADSPASINDGNDVAASCDAVLKDLGGTDKLAQYDAALIACYSVHPLVQQLPGLPGLKGRIAVTGIFEASVLASLSLLVGVSPEATWGVVTTGKFWEEHLSHGVKEFLGGDPSARNSKFAGVESTGLNAGDFHGGVSQEVIRAKLKEATKRLLDSGNVGCVVMGCAGMAGLEEIIRSAAVETYGEEAAKQLYIVDGVKAGIGVLEQIVKNKALFQGKIATRP